MIWSSPLQEAIPGQQRYWHCRASGLAENARQRRRDVCRRDTCLRLKLDEPLAQPRFK